MVVRTILCMTARKVLVEPCDEERDRDGEAAREEKNESLSA
jgi:hypothetical protein